MINWDDAQQICKDLASDSTTASVTFFKRMMNIGYKLVLTSLGRPVTEKTSSGLVTEASTQWIDLPMDCLFVKSVTVTIGSNSYPVTEEESQESWDYLNQTTQTSDIPSRFFVRLNYGVGASQLGLYPIPATASNVVTVVYEVITKNLGNDAYATGTVTFTNGDATVLGSTTTFTSGMVDRYILGNDGYYYRIATFTDTTHLELDKKYEGATVAGITTAISEMFVLPENLQILPVYFALAHYYSMKKNQNESAKYWAMLTSGVNEGKRVFSTKTRSGIIRSKGGVSWLNWAPSNFPTSITGS